MSIITHSFMVLQCVASQTVPSLPYSKPIAWIFVEVGNLRHIPMFPTCTRLLLISYCSTPAWFCTSCCHFDGSFRFVVFAIGLLRHFLYPILDLLVFAPNTFYTHNLSKYGLFQSPSQYGPFQNPGLHTCFGLNLNCGLNKTKCFCIKTVFCTKNCFTRKPCYPQTL